MLEVGAERGILHGNLLHLPGVVLEADVEIYPSPPIWGSLIKFPGGPKEISIGYRGRIIAGSNWYGFYSSGVS